MFANLHLHSTYSDGVHTPATLAATCYGMGYRAAVLTDHQTANGYPEFKKWCDFLGIETIIGAELYGRFDGYLCHLTAYHFDPTENKIAQFFRNYEDSYRGTAKETFDACVREGIIRGITWNDVLDNSPEHALLGNEQIFATLIKFGFNRQQDYWDWIKRYNSVKIEGNYALPFPDASEMITMVRNAGGLIFLAHPHRTAHLIPGLYELGLRGAEYSHPDIDAADASMVFQFAATHRDFYLSGGTDHSGLPGNTMQRNGHPQRITDTKHCSYLEASDNPNLRRGVTEFEWLQLKNRALG